eukprot:CAMPEP_0194530592 /NCGR_PEP_ID=MMETSP0253-20130528/67590_1 /TAXON_ID=2966 /ORGANISM="Noctiluca scintillans" /LENGTH=55 /DNA_ID=CAMNT_0039375843 /DNA_START=37 /DNA_END=201 /DNA_ORIENTATION=-
MDGRSATGSVDLMNAAFAQRTEEAAAGRRALVKKWWDLSRPKRGGTVARKPQGCR